MNTTPRMGVAKGIAVSVVLALLVAMGELSRLSGQVLDTTGRAWAFNALMGPGRALSIGPDGWTARFVGYGEQRSAWLAAFVVLDLAFIAVYGLLVPAWLPAPEATLARTLRVLAGVDFFEDVGALLATRTSEATATWVGSVTSVLTTLKWLVVVVLVVLLVRRLLQPDARAQIGGWALAVYKQRFGVLAILPIGVLSVPAGSDLLDQLPDVQRRWVEDGTGLAHGLAAVVVVAVVSAGVLVLGRMRSGSLWQRTPAAVAAEQPADLRLGFIVPGVVLVAMVVIYAQGGGLPWSMPGLQPWRLVAFLAVPLVIVLVSWFVRWRLAAGPTGWWHDHFQVKPHRIPSADEKAKTVVTGDVLGAVAVVITALGLLRSFTAVLALAAVDLGGSWRAVWPLVVGAVFVVLAWFVARGAADLVTDDGLAGQDPAGWSLWTRFKATMTPTVTIPGRLGLRLGLLVLGIALFFVVGRFAQPFGSGLGVIATSLLALLAAALVVGGSVVLVQDQKPPEIFWFKGIRLRSLPVTGLLLLTIAVTTGLGSNVDIHGVRGLETGAGAPVAVSTRPTMSDAVGLWSAATEGCGHVVTAGGVTYRLRPMFLFGAEGGGIRAAYWTAAGLDLFRGAAVPATDGVDWSQKQPENRCARGLFGGGASGGAVGLTVARFAATGLARDAAYAMATPNALGAATSGLFVRDTAYSATGVPFFGSPAFVAGRDPAGLTWLDRAGLMETSWEQTSGLSVPFLPADPTSGATAVTGDLILNSTRVADGCRMWVSQVALGAGDQTTCDFAATPAGHTVDLFAALGAGAAGSAADADHCLGPVSAATGTMLASRFPFVTPSGVAGPCVRQSEQQLVDGGYVENSGLATIVDLAPSWLTEVQRRNAAALAASAGPGGVSGSAFPVDLIVPVVIYFDNGTGGDLVVDPKAPTSELLVPSTTTGRAKAALIDTPALLRNSARLIASASLFGGPTAPPPALVQQIDGWRPKPVVVVRQSTFPAVTAPLGWVLSQESMATMDRALAQQAAQADPESVDPQNTVVTVDANGSLRDAIRLARPDGP
ncbi:MAG: hypothetical protein ABJA89_16435 [Lapillicoccus sp.]